MPIYEYQCDQCGHQFDAIQKFSDVSLEDCPACEKSALRKKISAPSFRLSGSGWYETDFKSDKEKKRNLAGDQQNISKSNTESSTSTVSKTDSKAKNKTDSNKPASAAS
jgi:putative FmdB family regulatory protein|tara:strand:+ start:1741 stop:2067 length:327 start_codon:yes stop_codon:yes gene_type:complete